MRGFSAITARARRATLRRACVGAVLACIAIPPLACISGPATAQAALLTPRMQTARVVASQKVAHTDSTTPDDDYPLYTVGTDAWAYGGGTGWINGFLPGQLWQQYQLTGATALRDSAIARQATFASNAHSTANHDLGFMFMSSYGNAYRLTGDARYRDTLLTAASSLSQRYDARVGMVRTANTAEDFWVYNDTMMNLELLFWGGRNGGDAQWRSMATSHALRTAEDFIRPDGGTYHYVAYDESTGDVIEKGQAQGYSTESTWSRGQAWMIHGMSIAYRETGDPRFLGAARRCTTYWAANVPDDFVPYWDFDAPDIPDEPRDSSAAAIAASAFLELARLDPDTSWRATYSELATDTLESLSSATYLTDGDPLPSVLRHGTHAANLGAIDHGTSWGDYYFGQALIRYATQVERVGGPDRYHTSSRSSYSTFDHADVAIVASGEAFPDALSACSLAGSFDAPVLLVGSRKLPATVRAELVRLGVRDVFVVGGPSAVSADVAAAIDRLAGVSVTRISGSDRFATAVQVARNVRDQSGSAPPFVFLARQDDFADSMAAAPISYAQGCPILLTSSASLDTQTERAIRELEPGAVVVLGGEGSISADVYDRVAAVSSDTQRIGGRTRYDTALQFAQWAKAGALSSGDEFGVVSGLSFPDALGAGASIGHRGGLVLMTPPDEFGTRAAGWLSQIADAQTRVVVFGGESAVAARAENDVRDCLPEQSD